MTLNTTTRNGANIWAAKWAGYCLLTVLNGAVCLGSAEGAYVDCTACHLDPAPGSGAPDYFEYFVNKDRQHIVAMAYPGPTNLDYKRPNAIAVDISFFDANGNGIVDPDEIQLFGIDHKVECSSCHREHGETPPPPDPKMYVRGSNADSGLCRICHER